MRGLALAALLLSLALAGCSVDTRRPDDSGNGGNGGGNGNDDGPTAEPEGDSGVLDVTVQSDGAATIEVPFPTLDSCRAPEDWMGGGASVTGAIPDLRNATGDRTGRVLVLETNSESAEWSVQIPLGPACETLVYDPWSTHPDRDDGGVEVHVTSGSVSSVTVLVRHVRDGSGAATMYEGPPQGNEWTPLPEKTTITF